MKTEQYFKDFEKDVKKVYEMAEKARAKGLDPVKEVEIPLAMSMAEKVVGLVSTIYPQMQDRGIAKRILALEKEYGKLEPTVSFKIAEEVAKQKFCKFASVLEAMDAGIRVGFAYITLAVVSSPIEGYTGIEVDKRLDGKEYIRANFSGPIRSAGTTASCMVLILIDFLREMFGYAKYDPTDEEVKRYVSELTDFHERITNLQYMPTEEEIIFLAQNLPIQIGGEKSEKLEVSNFKNLPRVSTNYLRSGVCLIIGEGLSQKAAKGFRLFNMAKKNGIKATGFDFLKEYIELHEKRDKGKTDDSPTYIKDLVAGRPVFGHPSKSGGFRFRYGRGRTSGFSAVSIHPATMAMTDSFIANGTQLKIEKPTKGCVVTSCDGVDGPIVKLLNGSVKKIQDKNEAKKLYPEVEEIIYLGDILFPFSDVANRNAQLVKPGYVEEWWELDLQKADKNAGKDLDAFEINLDKAVEISKKFKIPLHPGHIFYWTEISKGEFFGLIEWLKHSRFDGKLIFPYNKTEQAKFSLGKRALELLGVEHEVTIENVVLPKEVGCALLINLGINVNLDEKKFLSEGIDERKYDLEGSVFDTINAVCEFIIKDKAGEFVGARMGRPEKAKLRKLTGSPNVLFPVGAEGGRLRSVQAAYDEGRVRSSFPLYHCEKCNRETIYPCCEICDSKCKKQFYFFETREKSFVKEKYGKKGTRYCNQTLDIKHYFDSAVEKLGLVKEEVPLLVKGVRGVSSGDKDTENLAKGILRARHDLQVNKDGTIRFDGTELPLVSFKPKEILVSVEKLKEMGYTKDAYDNALVDEEQILELKPHDVLLPCPVDTNDEKADDVFMRVADFIDEELERFYGLERFHNLRGKEDLVGQLGVCMAPHNCAGVICRFIGFSNTQGLLASPYMHAAIRRDCDGDEAAIMLLSDVLLNFSRKYLPGHRGGTQDAPLVLNARINAGEVDDQILDFEFLYKYPLELYKKAEKKVHSSEVKVNMVRDLLKQGKDPFVGAGFTHNTNNFNEGVTCSNYKSLATMQDKVRHQMELVEKLRSADTADTARLIIDRHFIRDMKGNLRRFSTQDFRCVACNEILNRPPLKGVCPKCRGKIIFTVHEGGIKKYLEPALELARKYNLSPYMRQNLELVKRFIDSIFGKELEKQQALKEWF
jgi:DNA polymerase II large subunit